MCQNRKGLLKTFVKYMMHLFWKTEVSRPCDYNCAYYKRFIHIHKYLLMFKVIAIQLTVMVMIIMAPLETSLIVDFLMGPTWGTPKSCRPQMGPMLAPWTLFLGIHIYTKFIVITIVVSSRWCIVSMIRITWNMNTTLKPVMQRFVTYEKPIMFS